MLHGLKKKTRKNENRKNETRIKGHRVVLMILIPAMLLTLCAGCGDNGTDDEKNRSTGETEISVTDEHYDTYTISEIEDLNTVYCFNNTGDTYTVIGTDTAETLTTLYKYTSSDFGLNWGRVEVIGEDANLETDDGLTKQITCAALNSDGSIIIGYGASDSEGYVESYIIEKWDNGSTEEIASADANDTYIRKLRSSDSDGSVYVYFDESIIKYDETGNEAYEINIPELIDFETGDTEIYVLTEDALYTYDSETGEKISEDTGITKTLGEEISDTYENSQSDVINCKRVIKLNEEQNNLYLMLEETIYAYDLENTGNICQVDCDKKSGEYIYDYIIDETDNNSIKITAVSSGDEALKLIAYSPEELETSYVEEESRYADEEPAEITVYSLRYAEFMEETIEIYENKHPNITVTYEYGVSDDNGVTVSDAVNALNAELMAGEGPDVILLDGLNVDDYAESGVLMELSDIYDEMLEENPNCLENIMTAYKTEDGLYAIPSSFYCYVVVAEENMIDSVLDMESITEYVSAYESNGVINALNIHEWESLFEIFYPLYSNEIVDSEENYDEEALREFLEDMKNLWDVLIEDTTDEEMTQYYAESEENEKLNQFYYYAVPLFDREYSGQEIVIATWRDLLDPANLYSIKYFGINNENFIYKSLFSETGNMYTPTLTYAINSNTNTPDAAKSFLKEMFSVEEQEYYKLSSLSYCQGIPVNVDAIYEFQLQKSYTMVEVGGNKYAVTSYIENEEDTDEVVEFFKTLDTPSNDDRIIYEAIEEGMAEYMEGTKSLDETVSDISSTINIYVNE